MYELFRHPKVADSGKREVSDEEMDALLLAHLF
jgi:hypothetical protein